LLVSELIHFLDSCREFLLDRESDFECQRRHAFYQQSADGVIDVVSDDMLAYRYGMLDAVFGARQN
jgi:hypothetical protein